MSRSSSTDGHGQGLRAAVAAAGLLVLLTAVAGAGLLHQSSVRPVVTSPQAVTVALGSVPSVGPPFSTFRDYRVVEVRFEPRAAHIYEVYPRPDAATCGDRRPSWSCPLAPAWLVTLVAPPQDGYQTIDVAMLVDAVHGTVYDWDVRAGP